MWSSVAPGSSAGSTPPFTSPAMSSSVVSGFSRTHAAVHIVCKVLIGSVRLQPDPRRRSHRLQGPHRWCPASAGPTPPFTSSAMSSSVVSGFSPTYATVHIVCNVLVGGVRLQPDLRRRSHRLQGPHRWCLASAGPTPPSGAPTEIPDRIRNQCRQFAVC
jgi:hypothetical protein